MSVVASAVLAAAATIEEQSLPVPSVVFPIIAISVFILRGAVTWSYRDVANRPAGKGVRYRATVIGPGVTPDVYWDGTSPGAYDRDADLVANDAITHLGDKLCRAN